VGAVVVEAAVVRVAVVGEAVVGAAVVGDAVVAAVDVVLAWLVVAKVLVVAAVRGLRPVRVVVIVKNTSNSIRWLGAALMLSVDGNIMLVIGHQLWLREQYYVQSSMYIGR